MADINKQQQSQTDAIFKFCSPCSVGIVGPTMTGKTFFTMKIIKHAADMFEMPPDKIIYAYGAAQDSFKHLEETVPNIIFHDGLPTEAFIDDTFDTTRSNLLILDDLIEDIGRSREICNLFIRGMHHKKVSIFMLYQNLFMQAPFMRTISLNLTYYVLMKTFRDKQQIFTLAKQCFPSEEKRMMEAYEDCIKRTRGYLVVNNSTTGDEEDRLTTNIFPGETLTMYQPKSA